MQMAGKGSWLVMVVEGEEEVGRLVLCTKTILGL